MLPFSFLAVFFIISAGDKHIMGNIYILKEIKFEAYVASVLILANEGGC